MAARTTTRWCQHLRELLESYGASTDIELVRVEDAHAAERERFLGSPTVRVDGEDIEPGSADHGDFGLKCGLFPTPDGLRGQPPTSGCSPRCNARKTGQDTGRLSDPA